MKYGILAAIFAFVSTAAACIRGFHALTVFMRVFDFLIRIFFGLIDLLLFTLLRLLDLLFLFFGSFCGFQGSLPLCLLFLSLNLGFLQDMVSFVVFLVAAAAAVTSMATVRVHRSSANLRDRTSIHRRSSL